MSPKEKALELLETLEIKDECPVPLQKIVDHIGYKAQLFPASEKTRHLACGVNRDEKIIMANAGDSKEEQRYAFAHAIAHVVMDETGGNVIDKKANLHPSMEEPAEWDANQFANELLMEGDLFLKKWDQLGGDQRRIAQVFVVSKERISTRAIALGIV
jgi:Zn-dependent peptidase ImmA (M78 family)